MQLTPEKTALWQESLQMYAGGNEAGNVGTWSAMRQMVDRK